MLRLMHLRDVDSTFLTLSPDTKVNAFARRRLYVFNTFTWYNSTLEFEHCSFQNHLSSMRVHATYLFHVEINFPPIIPNSATSYRVGDEWYVYQVSSTKQQQKKRNILSFQHADNFIISHKSQHRLRNVHPRLLNISTTPFSLSVLQ